MVSSSRSRSATGRQTISLFIGRVVLNDRNCVGGTPSPAISTSPFPAAAERSPRILSHFELYVIQPRHAGFKVVRVLRKIGSLPPSFLLELKRAAADRDAC